MIHNKRGSRSGGKWEEGIRELSMPGGVRSMSCTGLCRASQKSLAESLGMCWSRCCWVAAGLPWTWIPTLSTLEAPRAAKKSSWVWEQNIACYWDMVWKRSTGNSWLLGWALGTVISIPSLTPSPLTSSWWKSTDLRAGHKGSPSALQPSWESWGCPAWTREGSGQNLLWLFST